MNNHSDVIVIGGGINGVSIAYHLVKQNLKVTLLEKNFIASGPTGLSSAIVRQHYSNPVTIRMAYQSLQVWQNFYEVIGGDAEFTRTGFMVGVVPTDLEGLKTNLELQRAEGVNTRYVPLEEIPTLAPHIDPTGLGGAGYEPDSGYCNPDAAANGFAKAAQELGAQIRTGIKATGFNIQGGKVAGVETDQGLINAGAAVVACGPWTQILLNTLGVKIPLVPARVKTVLYRCPKDLDRFMIWADFANQVYFRPETGNLMLVGSISPQEAEDQVADPDKFNEAVELDVVAEFAEQVVKRVPAMTRSHLANSFAALYDITPDWHPILDQVPGFGNLYVCAGSSGHGFKLAPEVGRMMADLMLNGKDQSDDIHLFSFDRFERGNLVRGKYEYSILG
jgi:glycine/D-amino acid oxidase-like deaminating enzyme